MCEGRNSAVQPSRRRPAFCLCRQVGLSPNHRYAPRMMRWNSSGNAAFCAGCHEAEDDEAILSHSVGTLQTFFGLGLTRLGAATPRWSWTSHHSQGMVRPFSCQLPKSSCLFPSMETQSLAKSCILFRPCQQQQTDAGSTGSEVPNCLKLCEAPQSSPAVIALLWAQAPVGEQSLEVSASLRLGSAWPASSCVLAPSRAAHVLRSSVRPLRLELGTRGPEPPAAVRSSFHAGCGFPKQLCLSVQLCMAVSCLMCCRHIPGE